MSMEASRKDHLRGKLDLVVLRILSCGDRMHGCVMAGRIKQLSDHNRRARFYHIGAAGRRQLARDTPAGSARPAPSPGY